jgi:redox-sensitive bicupin YhaK (pirin superfamily)
MTTTTTLYRPSADRGRTRIDWLDSYHTFSFGDYYDPRHMHFGALRVINEDIVAPGQGFGTHPHRDMEIITYVLEGSLQHRDSLGTGSVIRPGEVQRMSAGTGITHSEFNASQSDPVHLLQIWIMPEVKGLQPEYEQKAYEPNGSIDRWQLVASRDGREGSVTVHQDVSLYLTQPRPGAEVTFQLPEKRQAWVQIARGSVTLNGQTYQQGDGIGVREAGDLLLKTEEPAEVLLFDLAKNA